MTTPTPARDTRAEKLEAYGWTNYEACVRDLASFEEAGLVVLDVVALHAAISDAYTYHYRNSINGCPCGWNKLGASHSDHVADVVLETLCGAR